MCPLYCPRTRKQLPSHCELQTDGILGSSSSSQRMFALSKVTSLPAQVPRDIWAIYDFHIFISPYELHTYICLFSEKWPHCLRPLCSRNHHIWASYSARPLLRREIRRQERQCPYKEMSCCARYVWVSQIKALLHKFIHERWIFTSGKTFFKKSYKWIENRKRTRRSMKTPIWKVKFRTPWHLN